MKKKPKVNKANNEKFAFYKETDEEIEEEKEKLKISNINDEISILFNNKKILIHKRSKPFVEVEYEKEDGITKKIPLIYCNSKKEKNQIFLSFSNKGYQINVTISEKEEIVSMKIDSKNENGKAIFSFPRGTNENFYGIKKNNRYECTNEIKKENIKKSRKYNSLFDIEIPNLISTNNYMLNITTAGIWKINIERNKINIELKGEEGKIELYYGENIDEIIEKYKENKNIVSKIPYILKEGIIINSTKEKAIKKMEYLSDNKIKISGLIINEENLKKEEIQNIINYTKAKNIKLIIKIKPYLPVDEYNEKFKLIKNKNGKKSLFRINRKKYYGIDFTNNETQKEYKNKIRKLLDAGVYGIFAEKGKIIKENIVLEKNKQENISSFYHIWQNTIKETMNEYGENTLFIRDIGSNSPKYGLLVSKESTWGNIKSKNNINKYLDSMKCKGIDNIIVEIGGTNKKFLYGKKNQKKWFEFAKNMPLIIIGDISKKIIVKNKEYYIRNIY